MTTTILASDDSVIFSVGNNIDYSYPDSHLRVLITVPNLDVPGGVANYFRSARHHFDEDKVYFEVGRTSDETGFLSTCKRILFDYWQFHLALLRGTFDLVQINPSLNTLSILRDGGFLLIAKLYKKPVLVFFHGWRPNIEKAIATRFNWLFRLVYGRADGLIVLATQFRDALRNMGVETPVFVESTFVDDGAFLDRGAVDLRLEREPDEINILFLARLDYGKGVSEAIDAFALLQQNCKRARLTIAGDGPARAAAEKDVSARGICNVHFLGFVRDAAKEQVFRDADIYLFASLMEGMPISLLEAMAAGLPIVTYPVGGVCDFFETGRMGFATAGPEAQAYVEPLARLLDNPRLRCEMGRYNFEYARTHFQASVVTERLLAIQATICANFRRPQQISS